MQVHNVVTVNVSFAVPKNDDENLYIYFGVPLGIAVVMIITFVSIIGCMIYYIRQTRKDAYNCLRGSNQT